MHYKEERPQISTSSLPQQTQPTPIINIYPQIHLTVDADQLVNRLVGGRGRVIRPITRAQPTVDPATPAPPAHQVEDANDDFEVVSNQQDN